MMMLRAWASEVRKSDNAMHDNAPAEKPRYEKVKRALI
jgi:hypothetical protein